MRLSSLANAVGAPVHGSDVAISAVTHDSRAVEPGSLYVAIPGAKVDGARFIPDALAAGAVAICATARWDGVPTIVAPDPRAALATFAAELHRHPDRELALVGLTGSLGKTSTSLLTEAALAGGGEPVGVIGSLGIRLGRSVVETGMTTPEAPAIHAALRSMVDRGVRLAVMEVTSHSIRLGRVAGIRYVAGVLTNIVPDEHLEFHPTPEHYIRTKMQFFDMLGPGAPLVVNVDDEVARRVTRDLDRPVIDVACRGTDADGAHVIPRLEAMANDGCRFTLEVRRPFATIDGGEVEPVTLAVHLPLLGSQQLGNAALAATVALAVGASPESIARGLAAASPIRRRMQIVRERAPMILDDTVGNPQSIRAVFETVRLLPPARLGVVYALRGMRGPVINASNVRTLLAEVPRDAQVVITESDEAAGPRDRVRPDEREAACAELRASGREVRYLPRLEDAIAAVLQGAGDGDLVLLLGAQGMDKGAEIAIKKLM